MTMFVFHSSRDHKLNYPPTLQEMLLCNVGVSENKLPQPYPVVYHFSTWKKWPYFGGKNHPPFQTNSTIRYCCMLIIYIYRHTYRHTYIQTDRQTYIHNFIQFNIPFNILIVNVRAQSFVDP